MLQSLKTFRDFIEARPELLRWMPGNLKVENCILLTEHTKDKEEMSITVLHIFDSGGIHIGTIEEPRWIPKQK